MPEFNNYVYFVLGRNSNASYSFTGYTDPDTGEIKAIYKGRKDAHGKDVPHRFKFDRAHRSMRVNKNERDIYGNNIVEFLRNYPECAESSHGSYAGEGKQRKQTNIWFQEINERKDADIAIEAKSAKIKAENVALYLEGDDLKAMAILFGEHRSDEGLQKHRVLEAAGADPEGFMKFYTAPDRHAKVLLTRAMNAKLVKQKGTLYLWEGVTVGTNYESAIAKLMDDAVLANAIEENLVALSA